MNKVFEIWSASNGQVNLYTEDYQIYQQMLKMVDSYGSYERNGRTFGWQFSVPKNKLSFVQKKILEKLSLEI